MVAKPSDVAAAAAAALTPAPASADSKVTLELHTKIVEPKPWQKSLTVQGTLVVAAGVAIASQGPAILAAFGVDPDSAAQATSAIAQVASGVGALMALIGRLRLGGLT